MSRSKKKPEPVDYLSLSPQPVVGADEAGRGCLAGPAVAGAVMLLFPQKFQDSKQIPPRQREIFAASIKKSHIFGIGLATVQEIDRMNIHQACLLAMRRAVEKAMRRAAETLGAKTALLLIDGMFTIKSLPQFPQTALVKGDQRAAPVMAAGIMAKTERDRLLGLYGRKYPEYGFEKHKGYPTKQHKEAIKKHGPCPLHRKSFSGVREYYEMPA